METINNQTNFLKADLESSIRKDSKVSIAAACFSIYAYKELKKELDSVKELRFIFTSPAFTTEKSPKEKREFYIPRLSRERSLYGTEFEVRLRNELNQKAVARECAEWIRKKAVFKSNSTNLNIMPFIDVESGSDSSVYMPINGFTTADLGCEKGNNMFTLITKFSTETAAEAPVCRQYLTIFNELWNDKEKLQDVTDIVIDNITAAYNENSADFLYFITLYNIFSEFMEDISEDVLPNEATGFKESQIWDKLYDFQRDAVLAVINKLEKYNGCILADSVGLGKTFTALGVIKYYENRNRSVLVLCPKKLADNWNTFKANYKNNPIAKDRLRYDVLFHTDLSRKTGKSNGLDLERLNWGNYDLVVIDESHYFRNGGNINDGKLNRYSRLLEDVVRAGVKTKVLMLSATPVNNRFIDLKNQLALAYEGNPSLINKKLNTSRSIDEIFRQAQTAFNEWNKYAPVDRTTEKLLKMLDFDFFEVLDSVTIARSRKHIEKYYNSKAVGTFPKRLKPISLQSPMTELSGCPSYSDIYASLDELNLSVYTPSDFIFESRRSKYENYNSNMGNTVFTQSDREKGISVIMKSNLLKRLESSVHSFVLTISRIRSHIQKNIDIIEKFEKNRQNASGISADSDISDIENDFDSDDITYDEFMIGKSVLIDLRDMDYMSWKQDLSDDLDVLTDLLKKLSVITEEHDTKLRTLLETISRKIENPINPGNRKVIIFTAFSDTAEYLYKAVSRFALEKYGLHSGLITGTIEGKTTNPKIRVSFNNILTCFSPISKEKDLLMPEVDAGIDILVATDCISEGQNLQDCDFLVNYDIHWNPVRIIQRFGRIDRIGSRNSVIQLVNFWPDMTLDEYINLKGRVDSRMKISVMTGTGDDNPISPDEKGDLEYRKQQLSRLKEEVVDIEDMSGGVSIMDLGLNEFRLDLLEYMKKYPEPESIPFGMHAVAASENNIPAGVIYVLKNLNDGVNINDRNRLHPFYMVWISEDGNVVCDHLSPKELLDRMRYICRGKTTPDKKLCAVFNKETKDGKDMSLYSELLENAIDSIIDVSEQSDLDSFLSGGSVSFIDNKVSGLDDFELICFLVIKDKNDR